MTAQVLQACDELLETLAALCRAHPTTSGASAPSPPPPPTDDHHACSGVLTEFVRCLRRSPCMQVRRRWRDDARSQGLDEENQARQAHTRRAGRA